jgi:ATP-binding cassette, subfamily B, bacterial PglK
VKVTIERDDFDRHSSPTAAARQMLDLMSRGERRRLLFLLPAVTANAIMQVIGIASVMPFLAIVASPEILQTNAYMRWTYETLGFQGTTAFMMFVGLMVLLTLILSNGFAAWTQFRLMRFSWDLNHSLSVRMLQTYLAKPYVFFLNQNTSGLAKNILNEVKHAISGFLVAWMNLISTGIASALILALLIVVNPMLALLTFVFLGGAYGVLFMAVRRGMEAAGRRRSQTDRARYKAASEALVGVKEIKLLGKERPFLKRFIRPSRDYARHMARQQVISSLPRFAFETIAFGGMLLIVLYLMWRNVGLEGVLPMLGVYAFASYRLLPKLQSIFSAMTDIRFNTSAVELLHHDLERGAPPLRVAREDVEPLPFRDRLELRGLSFAYPNARHEVLESFDLVIRARTSVALVGATGSGKTTTIDLLLGLLTPQTGRLVVDGVTVTDQNLAAWQKNLCYVPQEIYLADDTVAANIAFGVPEGKIDQEAVERAARAANIHDFIVTELDLGYDTEVGERGVRLSGGQRQRLGIARALYNDPDVLILDEATSALDSVTEQSIFHAVNEIGKSKTIVMIAHRLTTVRGCDVIYLLDRGRVLAAGPYEELLHTSPEFRALARVDEVMAEAAG